MINQLLIRKLLTIKSINRLTVFLILNEVSRSPKVGLPISGNLGVQKSHVKSRVK